MGGVCQRDKERQGKVERERSVSVIKSASEELPFSMGYILYKLSNLHTWETKIGGSEGGIRIHNCEAREKDRNRMGSRGRGHGSLSIQS